MPTAVDPNVSRAKFAKEVDHLLGLGADLRKRGWLIEATSFPRVRVTFLSGKVHPPAALLTTDIDFTNYDLWAPSVRFLHPVTLEPLPHQPGGLLDAPRTDAKGGTYNLIVSGHPDTHEAFLCVPGTREYHTHPQHTGDSWLLHRPGKAGILYELLDRIWSYCILTVKGPAFQFNIAVSLEREPRP